ncbi:hypothetical protein AB0N05_37755 [Nocardia sp. NPDC051030]|uniref:hypothetical protein n=1 Tax=Nocardia sp. NPDC051030 TaxID=3155162 RepID=UPI003443232F
MVLAADHVVLVAAQPTTLGCAEVLVLATLSRWGIGAAAPEVGTVMRELVSETAQSTPAWSRFVAELVLTTKGVIVRIADCCDRAPIDGRWTCRLNEGGGRVVEQVVPLTESSFIQTPLQAITLTQNRGKGVHAGGKGAEHDL